MLTACPNTEEIVAEAKKAGWDCEIRPDGTRFFRKEGHPVVVVLQKITDDSWYSYTNAASYARSLGLEIEPPPKGVPWVPSGPEQT